MTIADLIAELQKLPPHLDVAVALDVPDAEVVDTEGDPCMVNLTPDCDCFGLSEIRFEGTWVQLVGGGAYYPLVGIG